MNVLKYILFFIAINIAILLIYISVGLLFVYTHKLGNFWYFVATFGFLTAMNFISKIIFYYVCRISPSATFAYWTTIILTILEGLYKMYTMIGLYPQKKGMIILMIFLVTYIVINALNKIKEELFERNEIETKMKEMIDHYKN